MRDKLTVIIVIFLLVSGLTIGYHEFKKGSNTKEDTDKTYDDLNMDEVKYNPTEDNLNKVIKGNNEFAFDLYHELNSNKNLFYSPWSISSALAMTYEGARNQTAEEMKKVFGFPDDKSQLRKSYGYLHDIYNTNNTNYEMSTANSAWMDDDFPILKEYKFILMNYYFSNVTNVDFRNNPSKACDMINNWVSNNTKGKIDNIVSESDITSYTRFVLGNAIYFKGRWAKPFNENDTQENTFYTDQNKEVTVPFMRQEGDFNYTSNDNFKILKKNYFGNETSMLFILPTEKSLDQTRNLITEENLQRWREDLQPKSMSLVSIPKFNFSSNYKLNNQLCDLGMPTAFSRGADFSGIDGSKSLFIRFVKHKAFIDVDEKGSEAAAATIVGMERTAIDERPRFIANRPFMFIIQDDITGNILFMGRVNDPTA